MVQPPDAKTKGKSLGLGKDKAYLRMGSSEGSPACLGARSQRGIYTSVYVSLYDGVRVYLGLVPSPPNPSFSRLEGGHQPGGGGQGLEKEMSPGNYGSIPSLGSCRDQHCTPRSP